MWVWAEAAAHAQVLGFDAKHHKKATKKQRTVTNLKNPNSITKLYNSLSQELYLSLTEDKKVLVNPMEKTFSKDSLEKSRSEAQNTECKTLQHFYLDIQKGELGKEQ